MVGIFWYLIRDSQKIVGMKTFRTPEQVKTYLESLEDYSGLTISWMVTEDISTEMPAAEFVKFEEVEHFRFRVGVI